MVRLLAVWGCGPGVGKSIITFGLSRDLVRRGLRVRVVKPATISSGAVWLPGDPRRFDIMSINYATASRCEMEVESVPVSLESRLQLIASDVFNGTYTVDGWVCGHYHGSGEVQEIHDWLPGCAEAVRESLRSAYARADVLIVEGSGSPADSAYVSEIANHYAVRQVERAALLIADCLQGNPFAQLIGTMEMLGPRATKVLGYLLNRTVGHVATPDRFRIAAESAGILDLGHVEAQPDTPVPATLQLGPEVRGDTRHLRVDTWFDEVADVVADQLDMETLLQNLAEVGGPCSWWD